MTVEEPEAAGEPPVTDTRSRNTSARAVAFNALSGYVSLLLGAGVGLITTRVMLERMGTARYGTWAVLVATVAYLGLLEAGLGNATTIRVATVEADGEEALGEVLSTALALCAVVAAIAAVLAIGLSFAVPSIFSIAHATRGDAVLAFALLGLAQAAGLYQLAYTAFLLGTGRMYLVNFGGIALSLATTISQAIIAAVHGSLAELAVVQLVGTVLTVVIYRLQTRRAFPRVSAVMRNGSRTVARRLIAFGWRYGVTSVAATLAFGSDLLLIGILLNPRAAAAYSVALSGYGFAQRLTTGVLGALGPSMAHIGARGDLERGFELARTALLMTLMIAIFAGAATGFCAYGLLHVWLGHVPARAATVLAILSGALILQCPGQVAESWFVSTDRAGRAMTLTLSGCALNIAVSIVCTVAFGVIGPALGTLIAVALFDGFYYPLRMCQMLQRSYVGLVGAAVKPLVIPAGLLCAGLVLVRLLIPADLLVVPAIGVAEAIYLGAACSSGPVRQLWSRVSNGSLRRYG